MRAQDNWYKSIGVAPAYALGLLAILAISIAWRFEEPSKLRTVIALLSIYHCGILTILFAKWKNLILSPGAWIASYSAKCVISFIIVTLFWTLPLTEVGLLRSPTAFDGAQDAIIYDHGAELAASTPGWSIDSLRTTWLSTGIVGYLTTIYKIFGVSVLYAAECNALLSLITSLAACSVFNSTSIRAMRDVACFVMLLPYSCYYDATPAKEPLTNVVYMLAFATFVRIVTGRANAAIAAPLALFYITLLAIVRANAALLFTVCAALFLARKWGAWKTVMIMLPAAVIIISASRITMDEGGLQSSIAGAASGDSARFQVEQRVEAESDNSLKLFVMRKLAPAGTVDLIVLAPVRALVWLVLPYPFLVPDIHILVQGKRILNDDPIAYFRLWSEPFAQVSGLLFVMALPMLVNAAARLRQTTPDVRAVVWFTLCNIGLVALVIGNTMYVMAKRYKIVAEPLMLILFCSLWGIGVRPPRWGRFYYIIVAAPCLALFIVKLISYH